MLQIAFQSTQRTVERLSFGLADAITEFGPKPFVDCTDLAGHVVACLGEPYSPHPTIIGIGKALNELKILQVVDAGSGGSSTLLEMIGNASLNDRSEITDIRQDTGLGKI